MATPDFDTLALRKKIREKADAAILRVSSSVVAGTTRT
jgi:hypothetical protein